MWATIATPLFLLALLLLTEHLIGPFEWDGREYEPRPARAAAEFLPAAVGFAAFVLGVRRRGRGPFMLLWAATSAVWAAVLLLQPA